MELFIYCIHFISIVDWFLFVKFLSHEESHFENILIFQKYVGAIELVGTKQAALQNIINGRPIRYIVRFPLPEPIPKLTSLVYNKQVLCTGPPGKSMLNCLVYQI